MDLQMKEAMTEPLTMMYITGVAPSPRGSIFSNFETVQLSSEERLLLHAAKLGDADLIKDLLSNDEVHSERLNVNCVDYMGRNALFLAVDTENVDAIEYLLGRVNWEAIEEALLHAISKSNRNIVRLMVDHPDYLAGEKTIRIHGRKDEFFRTEEKYQFPPDINPLILSAHKNDHELVQLFLSRGYTVARPHSIDCHCSDCQVKQDRDSLKRSRSRLNAYKALASPAYMALSSPDPITTTFELRQEMKRVAQVEKEFRKEYLSLVEQCMDFACELMDLCRGTQEVQAILGGENMESSNSKDPLNRLRLAIQYGEKKFVAHPNCQQHLTSAWYGKEMGFLQALSITKKVMLSIVCLPVLPFLCIVYIVNPKAKVSCVLKSPVIKFITHTLSHFVFLFLLAVATFGLEEILYEEGEESRVYSGLRVIFNFSEVVDDSMYHYHQFRPARSTITHVQILIIFWVIGLLWIECKQIYSSGAQEHFRQYYNYMDFCIIALYMASYALRFVAVYRIHQADSFFNATKRMHEASQNTDALARFAQMATLRNEFRKAENFTYGYFMQASRFYWSHEDPEIVSDILFAIANVLSFARTTYVMPSHELLGPLQISLGRMLGDITRFVVLFCLVLFAFMVGMTNLYRYYGTHIDAKRGAASSETFKGLLETIYTLFFSIFGLITLDQLHIKLPQQIGEERPNLKSSLLVDRVGMLMFALYQVTVTIVLVNILIAMMSHSFEDVQTDNDVEWKFARTKLWMNYVDECNTLPVPFNMLPTPKSVSYAWRFIRELFTGPDDISNITYDFSRRRENLFLPDPEAVKNLLLHKGSTYSEIMQRLVRRYLFKLERDDENSEMERTPAPLPDEQQDDQTLNMIREDSAEAVTLPLHLPQDSRRSSASAPRPDTLNTPEHSPSIRKFSFAIPDKNSLPRPVSPISNTSIQPSPTGFTGFTRSVSAEALRQLTRKATLRRATRRSFRKSGPNTAQLEAIQKGQRVLDARLKDLQASKTEESIAHENVEHMRHILADHQRKLDTMTNGMDTIQDEIRNLAAHMSVLKRTPSMPRVLGGRRFPGFRSSLRRKRSDPTQV